MVGWRSWRWVVRLRGRLCARRGHRTHEFAASGVVATPEGPFRLMGRCACGAVHYGQFLSRDETLAWEAEQRIREVELRGLAAIAGDGLPPIPPEARWEGGSGVKA